MNSAHRVKAVVDRYRLTVSGPIKNKRVLLVDDRTDTGWTLTVAARELRRVGVVSVYPFVLAQG